MSIGITDSGLGGLSILADVEAHLRMHPIREDVELFYLNAAPEDEYAYNSMPTREEKLNTFDRFLLSAAERYEPEFLFIACNTLSVLYSETRFSRRGLFPVLGIVDPGVQKMVHAYRRDPDTRLINFGTETTIEEGTYFRRLREFDVPGEKIAQQICPGLADAISNDSSGLLAMQRLGEYISTALEQFPKKPSKVSAFLGCTHYAYQSDLFRKGLLAHVDEVRILNPNPSARDIILASLDHTPGNGSLSVEFVTRYPIPEIEMESLQQYLGVLAPTTLAAFQSYTHIPDLF